MSGIDGTRTISIPSMSYNYVDNRLESIGTCGELYYRERGAYAPYAGTRWHELFGTPERAARTVAEYGKTIYSCDECLLCHDSIGATCEINGDCPWADEESGHDALLEWLKQDVDA